VRASERASRSGNKEGDKRARRAVVIYDDESKREREGERASEREKEEPAARQHRLLQNSFLPAALASIASPISRGKILSLCIRWSEICMTR
jgi:hypothetical protein